MAIKEDVCAYCGIWTQTEQEHVVAQSFAPDELRANCRWVLVPACSRCNRGFSADESDFRDFCVLAGSTGTTYIRDALFYGPLWRNWKRSDGRGHGALRRVLARSQRPDDISPSSNDDLTEDFGEVRLCADGKHISRRAENCEGAILQPFRQSMRRLPAGAAGRADSRNADFDAKLDFMDGVHGLACHPRCSVPVRFR